MNLQKALNQAAVKFGYRDYLHAQTYSKNHNPWWFIDEVILGDTSDPSYSYLSQKQVNHRDERLGEISISPADANGVNDRG
jgi:hypothetical protein